MYIRKTVRRYKDKTYVNFLLVESVLTDKGPRQKVICSLGDLSPAPPQQWLALARKLQDALTGQLSLPGMADEDPELEQLKQALPVQAAPPGDVNTTASITPSSGRSDFGTHRSRHLRIPQARRSRPRRSGILEAVGPGRHLEITGLLPVVGVVDLRDDA